MPQGPLPSGVKAGGQWPNLWPPRAQTSLLPRGAWRNSALSPTLVTCWFIPLGSFYPFPVSLLSLLLNCSWNHLSIIFHDHDLAAGAASWGDSNQDLRDGCFHGVTDQLMFLDFIAALPHLGGGRRQSFLGTSATQLCCLIPSSQSHRACHYGHLSHEDTGAWGR